MRVTDKQVFEGAIRNTALAREKAEAASLAASSGMRVSHPGDDPAASGLIAGYALSSARLTAMQKAAEASSDELVTADSALGTVGNVLARARQLAVQFSTSTYDASQRSAAAAEVSGLFSQVVAAANSRFGDRYLFGGTADGAPPFSAAGVYGGSATMRSVEVAPGVQVQSSLDANAILRGSAGGVDVLGVLEELQVALAGGSAAPVQGTLDRLDGAISQLAGARADAGMAMSSFDAAAAASKAMAGDDAMAGAKLGEVDFVQSAIELTQSQQALEASLSASAQSFRLTLLNFLK